jgi:hypothetical protein
MIHKKLGMIGVAFLLAIASTVFGQKANLSQQDIDAAIAAGRAAKNAKNLPSFAKFGLSLVKAPWSIYPESIVIGAYTPTTWIEYQAYDAAIKYKDFIPTDDDKKPVLRVIALTSAHQMKCLNVLAVVLKDFSKSVVAKPISESPLDNSWMNLNGAKVACTGLTSLFQLTDLQRVRGPNGTGEFFVVAVVDYGGPKEVEVKVEPKEFNKLL